MLSEQMLLYILLVFGLYFVQIYLAGYFSLAINGVEKQVGPRDDMKPGGVLAGRANRALHNLKENLVFFFVPALLTFVLENVDQGIAILGAQLFLAGRVAFVIFYMLGTPWVRSIAYGVGLAGNLTMIWALFG